MSFLERRLNTHDEDCTPLERCRGCRAASFLQSRLGTGNFLHFVRILEVDPPPTPAMADPVAALELEVFTLRSLTHYGINTVGDLVQLTEQELFNKFRFSTRETNEIQNALVLVNLRLGMRLT